MRSNPLTTPTCLSWYWFVRWIVRCICFKANEISCTHQSTDGIGTKVKLAASVGRYRGIGHDAGITVSTIFLCKAQSLCFYGLLCDIEIGRSVRRPWNARVSVHDVGLAAHGMGAVWHLADYRRACLRRVRLPALASSRGCRPRLGGLLGRSQPLEHLKELLGGCWTHDRYGAHRHDDRAIGDDEWHRAGRARVYRREVDERRLFI